MPLSVNGEGTTARTGVRFFHPAMPELGDKGGKSGRRIRHGLLLEYAYGKEVNEI